MYRNIRQILLIAGLLGLYACSSPQVMGPSGGGIPMPPGGGIPSPGGGGIPSPGGGTPSPGGGGIPSPGGGIPSPGDGSAGIPGGSGGGGGSGDASNDGGGGIPSPGEGQAGGAGGDTDGGGGSGGDSDGPGGPGGDSDVFGSGSGSEGDRQAGRGGDDEFDRALEDFDEVIAQEREAIGNENGEAADEVVASTAGSGVMGSDGGNETGERAIIGGPTGEPPSRTAVQVEGCNDDDTVARQLCEAATMEQDPFLRAALWDEYNAYKEILSRQ